MPVYPGIDATTRAELGKFLKSRRARLSPVSVGLPDGPRRRTPGLRREEVAELAGVGLTWYTWLEQGRDIRVSDQVLDAIARALRSEPAERAYLFRLAGRTLADATPAAASISPRLQRILDAWDPLPAHVTGRRRDVLAWNHASDAVYGWSQLPDDDRNILWFAFMVPSTRKLFVDWEREVTLSIAAFRAEAGRDLSHPYYKDLVDELLANSPDFARLWARQDVRGRVEGLRRFRHAVVGRFDVESMSFQVAEQPSLRLFLHMPAADGRSEAKLREIVSAASSRSLRSTARSLHP